MKFWWRLFGSGKKADRCLRKGLGEKKIVNCEQHGTGAARLEEVFFDSKVWLDSDVEDFFSVNGDLTPSCGNTPIHPSSVVQTPERSDTDKNLDIEPSASPADGKKRLSEFLGENLIDEKNTSNNEGATTSEIQKPRNGNFWSQKSANGSPYASVSSSVCSSSERTPTKGLKPPKYKSAYSSPCCLPGLSYRPKKKKLVPAHL